MAQQVKGLRAPPLSSGGRRPPPRGGAPTPAAHRGALAELQRACALRLRLAHTPLAAPEGGGFSPPGPGAATAPSTFPWRGAASLPPLRGQGGCGDHRKNRKLIATVGAEAPGAPPASGRLTPRACNP